MKIRGYFVNNLTCADHTVLIAQLLDIVEKENRKKGLESNSKKTISDRQ